MKLLMISTDRTIFDPQSPVALRQIEYAKKYEEVHIIVFTQGKDFQEISLSSNCWVYPTKSWTRWMYPFDAIRLGRFIVERRGITNLTTQDASLTAMAGISLKKQFNLPLEIQLHEDIGSPYFSISSLTHRIRKALALSYLPKADHIRVVSGKIRTYLTEKLSIPESSIEVRPITVDIERVRSAAITADLHKKYFQFDKIILVASRLEPEKNVQLALTAFVQVLEKIPKAGLIVVGSGREKSRLTGIARKYGVERSVIFEDWIDREMLFSYYKTADVFLNTSLFEGYGMTLVEAQAAGCPIISTDVGVARETGATIVGYNIRELADMIVAKLT